MLPIARPYPGAAPQNKADSVLAGEAKRPGRDGVPWPG
jgi:hypothetical protein